MCTSGWLQERYISFLEKQLQDTLVKIAKDKKNPVFTTALIAGDCVILDAIAKAGLLDKITVVFIDTFFLFPETIDFMKEVEEHYGFKAKCRERTRAVYKIHSETNSREW